MSGEKTVMQAYEHAVRMAREARRPVFESLQRAAKAEAYAFALCQYSRDLTGIGGLLFWHEKALLASRLRRQRWAELCLDHNQGVK